MMPMTASCSDRGAVGMPKDSWNGIPEDVQNKVLAIISQIPFKGSETVFPDTLEGKIVQDADR